MDMQRLLSQAMKLQEDLSHTQKELDEHSYTESMGGGAVSVTVRGNMSVSNIEISDEKLDEELAKMAESYKMEVDKLKEFMGENEKKQMKEDMAVQEAVTFLVENAVEK